MALKAIPGSTSGALKSLEYAISKGAKVSSNSYGSLYGNSNGYKNILDNNPHHIFVVAAGNGGLELKGSTFTSPCSTASSNVLCVANSNKQDEKYWDSNYGTDYVHVFAPGTKILSCYYKSISSYAWMTGTRYDLKSHVIF